MFTPNEKIQEHVTNYVLLWEATKGSDFDKTLVLLKTYCGHDKYLSRSHWNLHVKGFEQVVAKYDGEDGYLKKYRNTLLCTTEYLVLELSNQLYQEYTSGNDKFLALVHVIKNHTGIDLQKCIELIQRGKQKDLYAIDYHIEKYKQTNTIPCTLLSMLTTLVNPIYRDETMHFALNCGLIKGGELIGHLIEKDEKMYDVIKFLSLYSISLSSQEEIKKLFKLALSRAECKRYNNLGLYYNVAYYLFCKYHLLDIPERNYSHFNGITSMDNFNSLVKMLTSVINKQIESDLLLEVVEHIQEYIKRIDSEMFEVIYAKSCNILYASLCNKSGFISTFSVLENKFIQYFKPDYNHALFIACNSLSKPVVNHLLNTKQPLLSERTWYRDKDLNRPFPFTSACTFDSSVAFIKTTPLLGMIANANYAYRKGISINYHNIHSYDNTYQDKMHSHMNLIKLLIKQSSESIKIKDEGGKDVFYYLNVFKENVLSNQGKFPVKINFWQQFNEITTLIYNLKYGYNKFLMFSCGSADENSVLHVLPQDLQNEINTTSMELYK